MGTPAPDPTPPGLGRWADTPLGDPSGWPTPLRTVAGMCLSTVLPGAVFWGERAFFLYNDAMATGLGVRHPGALGQPLYEALPDTWPTVGPLLSETMRTGHASAGRRFPLRVDSGNGPRVRFVDYSCVPVRDETDRVCGVWFALTDSTAVHLRDRHREALARIATIPVECPRPDVAEQIGRELVALADVRFAVVFLPDADGRPERTATVGGPLRPRGTRAAIDLAVGRGQWPVSALFAGTLEGPTRAADPPVGMERPRPSWQTAWLAPLTATRRSGRETVGVIALGLDERIETPTAATDLVAMLAGAAAERLAR